MISEEAWLLSCKKESSAQLENPILTTGSTGDWCGPRQRQVNAPPLQQLFHHPLLRDLTTMGSSGTAIIFLSAHPHRDLSKRVRSKPHLDMGFVFGARARARTRECKLKMKQVLSTLFPGGGTASNRKMAGACMGVYEVSTVVHLGSMREDLDFLN